MAARGQQVAPSGGLGAGSELSLAELRAGRFGGEIQAPSGCGGPNKSLRAAKQADNNGVLHNEGCIELPLQLAARVALVASWTLHTVSGKLNTEHWSVHSA